jgi:hypothetical protein
MTIVPLILQIAALICLFFATFRLFQGPPNRPEWGWAGLFLWLLSLMISGGIALHATT